MRNLISKLIEIIFQSRALYIVICMTLGFNMHDLHATDNCGVKINAANPISDVKSYIQNKVNADEKNIVIPQGTYTFNLHDYKPLTIHNRSDITIDGSGSHFICNQNTRVIDLKYSHNITLKNFSIDFDPLPFTQGEIVAVGEDHTKWFDVRIHDGYDIDRIALNNTEFFDENTLELKKNASAMYQSYVDSNIEINYAARIVRIRKNSTCPDYYQETQGNLVVFNNKKEERALSHTIYTESNTDCTFLNITLYSSNGFGFYEFGSSHSTYDNCQIKRKTNDTKVAFPRLRSGNSDGIDCRGSLAGPTIRNCTIMHNSDDCIAISGRFYIVIQEAYKKLAIASYMPMDIKAGDSIRIVGRDGTLRYNKVVSITKSSPSNFNSVVYSSALHAFDQITTNIYNQFYGKDVYEITLAETSNAQAGEVVYVKEKSCSGFSITNNKVGFNRARGALIKASHGEVTGNTFNSCQLPGISVAPELYYMESGYSEDLLIADNTIKDCNFGHTRSGWEQAGALNVSAQNVYKEFSKPAGFKNIRIENNTIIGAPRPSVVLTSIDGGYFKNNKVQSDASLLRYNGSFLGVKNDVDVWSVNNKRFIITDDSSTSIDSPLQHQNMVGIIYNANQYIISSGDDKIMSLRIHDSLGRTLYEKNFNYGNNISVLETELRSISTLLLFTVVLENKSSHTLKFITKTK